MIPAIRFFTLYLAAPLILSFAGMAVADTLKLADGTVLSNVYVRDDLRHFTVWGDAESIGDQPLRIVALDEVADPETALTIDRPASIWQRPVDLIDWQIVALQIQPLRPSFQGLIKLDEHARPIPDIDASPAIRDIGEELFTNPRKALARTARLHYYDGQRMNVYLTLRNNGSEPAPPCVFAWYLNGRFLARGNFDNETAAGAARDAMMKLIWRDGYNVLDIVLESEGLERSAVNNTLVEPLWSRGFDVYVSKGRANAWRDFRSPAGTHGLEGYVQWHFDAVNALLEQSRYPEAPYGARCRARINRFVYADLVKDGVPRIDGEPVNLLSRLGFASAEGRLIWNETPEEVRTGRFIPGDGGPWSIDDHLSIDLLRQILWQLGLPDYAVLEPEKQDLLRPTSTAAAGILTDDKARVLDELSILHLNRIEKLPRGYRGELYFGLPQTLILRCLDGDGDPLANADVVAYQRGVQVDTAAEPVTTAAGVYWPVTYSPLGDITARKTFSAQPVMHCKTDAAGECELPNRPAALVKTLTRYERKANSFGEVDPLGLRGALRVEVTHAGQTHRFHVSVADAALVWQRGVQERGVLELRLPK